MNHPEHHVHFRPKGIKSFIKFAKDHKIPIDPQRRYIGIFFTLFSWFLVGFSTVLFQSAIKEVPIFVFFTISFFVAFVVLLIWCLASKVKLIGVENKLLILRGFLASLGYLLYAASSIWTNVIDNSMLFGCDPLFIPILMLFLFKQKIDKIEWVGLLIGFLGIAFVYSFDISSKNMIGGVVGISASMILALIIIMACYMVKLDPPLRIALYQTFIGFICVGVASLFSGQWIQSIGTKDWFFCIYSGVFFAFSLLLYLDSLYYTEVHVIGTLGYSLVLFVELINWIVYQGAVTMKTIVGSFLICAGGLTVIIVQYRNDKKKDNYPKEIGKS